MFRLMGLLKNKFQLIKILDKNPSNTKKNNHHHTSHNFLIVVTPTHPSMQVQQNNKDKKRTTIKTITAHIILIHIGQGTNVIVKLVSNLSMEFVSVIDYLLSIQWGLVSLSTNFPSILLSVGSFKYMMEGHVSVKGGIEVVWVSVPKINLINTNQAMIQVLILWYALQIAVCFLDMIVNVMKAIRQKIMNASRSKIKIVQKTQP